MSDETNQANVDEEGAHVVMCAKLGQILPGLENPPFLGELGERIFNQISQLAWQMWLEQQVLLINHYGLNLADPTARGFLMEQTEEFFFGVGGQMPEGWTPEGTPGAGQKGDGPQQKK